MRPAALQYGWFPASCTTLRSVLCEVPKHRFTCPPAPPPRPPPPDVSVCKSVWSDHLRVGIILVAAKTLYMDCMTSVTILQLQQAPACKGPLSY